MTAKSAIGSMHAVLSRPLTLHEPLAGDPEDGTYAGHLVLEPSRPVALLTKRLDSYFGGTLDFRLPVEIVTQPPESLTESPSPTRP